MRHTTGRSPGRKSPGDGAPVRSTGNGNASSADGARASSAAPTLVAGAGGFIGGHLVRALIERGERVRAVDVKPRGEWFQVHGEAENLELDLARREACAEAAAGAARVYNLAADMGGIGFIASHDADCMSSVLINAHLLAAARDAGVERYFYASSACVYATDRQLAPEATALTEADAYPALPDGGYGWEKLFSERMCQAFRADYGLETRIGRYHNAYGPHGAWEGGREKAPAAICRKVAEAELRGAGEFEVWGDGRQTRSFMYVDDCVEGTLRVADSAYPEPLNIGSAELVSIDELCDAVTAAAGVELARRYDPTAPQGVRGRNSDNTLARRVLGWEPRTSLADGIAPTYEWVRERVVARADVAAAGAV